MQQSTTSFSQRKILTRSKAINKNWLEAEYSVTEEKKIKSRRAAIKKEICYEYQEEEEKVPLKKMVH